MRIVDIDNLPRHGGRGGLVYWKDIEEQATEITLCKDCKWYINNTTVEASLKYCHWRTDENPDEDDFCPLGERREE